MGYVIFEAMLKCLDGHSDEVTSVLYAATATKCSRGQIIRALKSGMRFLDDVELWAFIHFLQNFVFVDVFSNMLSRAILIA